MPSTTVLTAIRLLSIYVQGLINNTSNDNFQANRKSSKYANLHLPSVTCRSTCLPTSEADISGHFTRMVANGTLPCLLLRMFCYQGVTSAPKIEYDDIISTRHLVANKATMHVISATKTRRSAQRVIEAVSYFYTYYVSRDIIKWHGRTQPHGQHRSSTKSH